MKLKISLILLTAAIVACSVAMLWHQPASGPAVILVSGPVANNVAGSFHGPGPSPAVPAQSNPPPPLPPPTAGESLARLIAELQQAYACTNLEQREFAFTNLLPALVAQDAAAAGRWAETITDADLREAAMRRVAQLWAAQDPSGALAWAAALTDPAGRDSTLTDICLQVAQTDPAAAVGLREQSVPDSVPNLALNGLMQQWAEQDFPTALAWTLERPQSAQRDDLIARLAFVESQFAPAEAADLVTEQMSPGPAQDEAVMSVLHQWALLDLTAATAWVSQYSEGPLRDRAVLELAGIAGTLRLP